MYTKLYLKNPRYTISKHFYYADKLKYFKKVNKFILMITVPFLLLAFLFPSSSSTELFTAFSGIFLK